MIIDNTVANAAHEIFNVLEGMSYKDAKATLERVADELDDYLFVGEPDDDEDEEDDEEDNTAEVLGKLSKIQALQKELAALGVKLPACKLVGLSV